MNNYHLISPYISKSAKIKGDRIQIGPLTEINDYVIIEINEGEISIGKRSKLKEGVIVKTYGGNIKIGDRSSIGEYSILAAHGGISIGNCTIIGGMCYLAASNHIFLSNDPIRFQGETKNGIIIGNNVWIGGRVTILDGISIGDNAIIGAASVVTNDIPSNSVSYGNPCKVAKMRKQEGVDNI